MSNQNMLNDFGIGFLLIAIMCSEDEQNQEKMKDQNLFN